ncbi:serine protease inhibitor 28Dc [Euwallacea fornicatus]|uniref:serine protease inhibitor 28Dc n=1 Tax=Euwallacea fornicatus TaxID=995702 RepID=UPI00338D41E9
MHHSRNLFSIFIFLQLSTLMVLANNSTIYFPPSEYDFNPVRDTAPRIAPNDLEVLRGTTIYEKFVDDLISQAVAKLTVEINRLLIVQSEGVENVLFSPVSIAGVLALVMLGSNGATFKQITQLWGLHVGIPDIDKKSQIVHEQLARMFYKLNQTTGFEVGDELKVASALFVQDGYPIRPVYRSIAEDLYQSSIVNVDFEANPKEAQNLVNNWVSAKTNQKIRNILNDVPPRETQIILASALYFKAEWEQHFFDALTKRRPFFINGKNSKATIEVTMMSNGGDFPYYKDHELGCEILGMPYKGNRSTMYVVMPFNSNITSLKQFEAKITVADLNRLVSRTKLTGAVILFPKMNIDSTIDLKKTLQLLGVTSLFDPKEANLALLSQGFTPQRASYSPVISANVTSRVETHQPAANLTENTEVPTLDSRIRVSENIDNIRQKINEQSTDNRYQNPGLYASQVIHKVFMDITEKGTEAAAATSVSLTRVGSRVTFRVDVPFFFFIRHDETNTILFWGSVASPNPSYQIV